MTSAVQHQPLLTPDEMQRLERLRLAPHRRFAGRLRGERISRQRGVSLEFRDFRDYTQGDDLRHLDWSVLARLDRPTVRTYQDEDDLAVYVLLDASASMDFGSPSNFEAARKLAAGLGFVGLVGQDAVTCIPLGAGAMPPRRLRSRAGYAALARQIAPVLPLGTDGLAESLRLFAHSASYRPGLVLCLTDGLDPEAPTALRGIGARGHELVVVQILSALELDPEMEGDLRLVDAESEGVVEITAHADALRQYKENLAVHCEKVQEAATRAGGRYLRVMSDAGLIDVLQDLRRLGVVE